MTGLKGSPLSKLTKRPREPQRNRHSRSNKLITNSRTIQIFWISEPDPEPNEVGSLGSDRYKDTIPLWENGKYGSTFLFLVPENFSLYLSYLVTLTYNRSYTEARRAATTSGCRRLTRRLTGIRR